MSQTWLRTLLSWSAITCSAYLNTHVRLRYAFQYGELSDHTFNWVFKSILIVPTFKSMLFYRRCSEYLCPIYSQSCQTRRRSLHISKFLSGNCDTPVLARAQVLTSGSHIFVTVWRSFHSRIVEWCKLRITQSIVSTIQMQYKRSIIQTFSYFSIKFGGHTLHETTIELPSTASCIDGRDG